MSPNTLEGQTLGKYRILEPLGRGGMAQVYRAYHPNLDRYVAVKVLRPELVEDPEFLARFRREARAVAALRHPNIVQVFDFDVQDDLYYMVMELLDGNTLKSRLDAFRTQGERLPLEEMTRILTQTLSGLAYAHQHGITHRDIKPANILLTRPGEAVITDFGIAQIVGGTNYTISGALMGTLHYMAPEQALTGKVDQRSDLYSLGVVFYEMLTGHPPFEADTPLAILLKHINDPLPLPHEPGLKIPAPYERVLLKTLEKRPEDRFQDADEMAQALHDAYARSLSGEQVDDVLPSIPLKPVEALAVEPDSSDLDERLTDPPVFSGTERRQIADAKMVEDVTEMNLAQRLQEELAENRSKLDGSRLKAGSPSATVEGNGAELSKAAGQFFSAVGGILTTALSVAAAEISSTSGPSKDAPVSPLSPEIHLEPGSNEAPVDEDAQPVEFQSQPRVVAQSAILGSGVLVGANLLAVVFGVMTGWWAPFQYGWPAELLLVAILLWLLMYSLGNIWMLIPAGILTGNGLVLGFYALTGRWELWAFLWIVEPLLVFGTISLSGTLARKPGRSRSQASRLGQVLALVSSALVIGIGLGTLVVGAFHRIFG